MKRYLISKDTPRQEEEEHQWSWGAFDGGWTKRWCVELKDPIANSCTSDDLTASVRTLNWGATVQYDVTKNSDID